MDFVSRLQKDFSSDEAIARRQGRRALRQKKIYANIQESLAEVQEANGTFSQRQAFLWNLDKHEGTRKINGHAGQEACAFVSETFGEFNIQGTIKSHFAGLQRSAGKGGHGITEGTILVDVELRPIHGMTQMVEVPVYVHDGRLQAPSIMYHQGSPMVIAQSAIDELMSAAKFGDRVEVDRKNMYTPPKTTNRKAHASHDTRGMMQEIDRRLHEIKQSTGEDLQPGIDEALASIRTPAELPIMLQEISKFLDEYAARPSDQITPEGSVDIEGKGLSQRDMSPMLRPNEVARQQSHEQMKSQQEQMAKQRRQRNTQNVPIVEGRPLVAGCLDRLACEITVPDTGLVLPEGSRVFVVATYDDGVHVKHETGAEALISPTYLTSQLS